MQGVRPVSRRVIAQQPRRLLASFYDSQSGKHVDLPSGPQVHVGLEAVPTDRVSSALAHLLLKDGTGSPIKGLASISQRQLVATASDVETVDAKQTGIAITISDLAAGVAAVVAARERQLRPRAILDPALCGDAYAVQLNAAELGDAGAEAILLSPSADASEDDLREMAEMACEIDLEGIPMRSRLGLCFTKPGAGQLPLAKFAYEELELLHFYTCLAGKRGPRPSELLQALGVRPVDARYGPMYLAEHVPELVCLRPQATYLVWIDCSGLEALLSKAAAAAAAPPLSVRDFLVKRARVLLSSGAEFGPEAEWRQYQRLNVACSRDMLEDSLARVRDAVRSIR